MDSKEQSGLVASADEVRNPRSPYECMKQWFNVAISGVLCFSAVDEAQFGFV